MVFTYNEFITEENREIKYWISQRLYELLDNMRSSSDDQRLVELIDEIIGINNNKTDNITYLDITDKNDTLSFFPLDKIFQVYYEEEKLTGDRGFKKISDDTFDDFISWIPTIYDRDFKNQKSWIWTNTKRSDIAVGRLLVKILTNIKVSYQQSEIEELVNLYKSTYDRIIGEKTFQLVSGDIILKYYLEDNYEVKSGDLNNSCMRYKKCQSYLSIYTQNPNKVKLLILKLNPNSDGIIGRSLIWTLENGKIFMDRVYTSFNSDVELYKNYAKEHNYLSYYDDPDDLTVQLDKYDFKQYPYMDSLVYLDMNNGILSSSGEGRELQTTDGTWSGEDDENYVYSETYGEDILRENAAWCVDINDWLHIDDAHWIEYKSEWYSDSSCIYSSELEEHILQEDAVYSEYLKSWIISDDSISIYTSSKAEDMDYVTDYTDNIVEDTISSRDTLDVLCYKIKVGNEDKYYFRDWKLTLIPINYFDDKPLQTNKSKLIIAKLHDSDWIILDSLIYPDIVLIDLNKIDYITLKIEDYLATLSDNKISLEEYQNNIIEKSKEGLRVDDNIYPFNSLVAKSLAYCFIKPKKSTKSSLRKVFSDEDLLDKIFTSKEKKFLLSKIEETTKYQQQEFLKFLKEYEKYSNYFLDSIEMIKFYNILKKKANKFEINERFYYPQ